MTFWVFLAEERERTVGAGDKLNLKNASNNIHSLIPATCEYVAVRGKRNSEDVI